MSFFNSFDLRASFSVNSEITLDFSSLKNAQRMSAYVKYCIISNFQARTCRQSPHRAAISCLEVLLERGSFPSRCFAIEPIRYRCFPGVVYTDVIRAPLQWRATEKDSAW